LCIFLLERPIGTVVGIIRVWRILLFPWEKRAGMTKSIRRIMRRHTKRRSEIDVQRRTVKSCPTAFGSKAIPIPRLQVGINQSMP